MTAATRAARHARDTCHWCPQPWIIAVDDQHGRTWGACRDHVDLLPPWITPADIPGKSTGSVQATHKTNGLLSKGITHVELVGDLGTPVANSLCVIQPGSPTNLTPQETPI